MLTAIYSFFSQEDNFYAPDGTIAGDPLLNGGDGIFYVVTTEDDANNEFPADAGTIHQITATGAATHSLHRGELASVPQLGGATGT